MNEKRPKTGDLVSDALQSAGGLHCLRSAVRGIERAIADTTHPEFADRLRKSAAELRAKYKEQSGKEL